MTPENLMGVVRPPHTLFEALALERLDALLSTVDRLLELLEVAIDDHMETPEGETPWTRFTPTLADTEAVLDVNDALRRLEAVLRP